MVLTQNNFILTYNHLKGTTRAQFEQLRNDIISCLATVEALIDFGEGEDIEEGVYEQGSVPQSIPRRQTFS